VLVKFWTYGCWNCKNVEPYVKQWYEKYMDRGFTVLAIHTPEFDYEKDISNVKNYISQNEITYPVAMDNDFSTWRDYGNRAWPAMYLVDKEGRIAYKKVGEGSYATTDSMIAKLIAK
jgi:thiol-disulfide isomerase/thioredoxin